MAPMAVSGGLRVVACWWRSTPASIPCPLAPRAVGDAEEGLRLARYAPRHDHSRGLSVRREGRGGSRWWPGSLSQASREGTYTSAF